MLDGGSRSPMRRGICGGYPAHCKVLGVSAAVYAAKGIILSSITARIERDHVILDNGTTCDAAFCQNFLTTCY